MTSETHPQQRPRMSREDAELFLRLVAERNRRDERNRSEDQGQAAPEPHDADQPARAKQTQPE